MNKEEVKQWLRSQIDSSIKIQFKFDKSNIYRLCYNKSYVRALKMSTITGQSVNKENFKGGEKLFCFDTGNKEFWYYSNIWDYLNENYSTNYYKRIIIIEEVINEYDDYKSYTHK